MSKITIPYWNPRPKPKPKNNYCGYIVCFKDRFFHRNIQTPILNDDQMKFEITINDSPSKSGFYFFYNVAIFKIKLK